MNINHRAEAEKHLANAARHLTEHPNDMRIAEVSAWIGQGHAVLAASQSTNAGVVKDDAPWGSDEGSLQTLANVVAVHLAEALLDSKSDEVRSWARGLAYELKRQQLDLSAEIARHIQRMALGNPDSEIPF